MKRLPIICITALMLFAACRNSGSSTVGTYEQEETQSSEKNESESHGQRSHENAETNTTHTQKVQGDTTHVEGGLSKDTVSADSENKH